MKFGIFGGKNEKNIKENDRHFPMCGNGGWHIWHNAGFCRGGRCQRTEHAGAGTQWPTGPEVQASSAVVMDASTGTVLFEKDADTPRYPASITKIMTTYWHWKIAVWMKLYIFRQQRYTKMKVALPILPEIWMRK